MFLRLQIKVEGCDVVNNNNNIFIKKPLSPKQNTLINFTLT